MGESLSSVDAGYTDLTGRPDIAGYVNRANEMGCISSGLYFYPDAPMQYAELYKIATCVTGLS